MKLSEVWEVYEADKKIEGFSPFTFKAYKIQHNLIIKHFEDVDIETLTLVDLKKYLAKDAGRLKPSSLGHKIRFIRGFFRYAHEEGYTPTFIASRIKEPKEGQRIPKFIVEEDLERLREAANGPREKALINLLYATGCRVGEVQGMNKQDVNWENRSIIVIGKGNKQREVYFDVKTYLWLKEYIKSRSDEEEALFVGERAPFKRSSTWSLRYAVKRIAERSEVDINVFPHRFRHSFATHLMDRGAPLEVISDLCGHQKIETTRIYTALSGKRRKELYQKYF